MYIMQFKKSLVLWALIIILLILVFPKTCGRTDYISKVIYYGCMGIEAPFFSSINDKYNWCYGICLESSIQQPDEINQTKPQEDSSFISGISQSLKKVIFPLIMIFAAIGIIKFISTLKARKSNVTVYKKIG